ncbi:MAG: type 1 glutamine amidotransferase [Pirellulales bacterium]
MHFLLLQIRNGDDPMRHHEVTCFGRAIGCPPERISVFDLLSGAPAPSVLTACDVVLLGGSGHYSAAGEGEWLERTLDVLRGIHALGLPTFASCWGFQAMARAMGGVVRHDPSLAELGTITLRLTACGEQDPLFGPLGPTFKGQAGHEDSVIELPPGAIRLASSDRVENQAYRFSDRPIYCTQFHPELRRADLLARLQAYPEYVRNLSGLPLEEFAQRCEETPEAATLLPRFVALLRDAH